MQASLLQKCTASTVENAQKFAEPLTETMQRFGIVTIRQKAAFLATVSVESWNLSKTEEGLYYKDAARLASIFPRVFKSVADAKPYVMNSKALGEVLYQGYFGRGLIQLTWRKNYEAAGKALGFDYVAHPEMVAQPQHAALTAGWFWSTNDCNTPADKADMRGVTLKVNGPALLHLSERMSQYVKTVSLLTGGTNE